MSVPYDNPLRGFCNGGKKLPDERGYIARRVRLYCRKSMVILPKERGYIAGRAWLYCRKSVVILAVWKDPRWTLGFWDS